MKIGKNRSRSLILAATCAMAFTATGASAQVRIQNSYRADQQINVETGPPASSPTQPGWLSAQWQIEPVDGSEFVRIRNVWKGTYLNNESGKLDSSAIQPGWWSAQWSLSKSGQGYRICNRWKATCLHTESGSLDLSDAPTNWASAVWLLNGYTPATRPATALVAPATPFLAPGPFKQCVSNVIGTGIVAKVEWYDANTVTYIPGHPDGDVARTKDVNEGMPTLDFGKDGRATPYKEENIALGQSSCINGVSPNEKPSLAIVSVVGGKYAAGAVSASAGTLIALAGILSCAPTLGAGCAAAAGSIAALAGGGLSVGMLGLPDPQEVFYVGVPGKLEVKGTVFSPVSNDITPIDSRTSLAYQRDATDVIKAAFVGEEVRRGERGIKFNNQAGYAASMSVMYFMMKNVSGVNVPTPVFVGTEKITAGFVRTVIIPQDTVPGTPINVTITGVATVSNPAFTTTVDGGFTGERCFKSYGSLFNPNGGPC